MSFSIRYKLLIYFLLLFVSQAVQAGAYIFAGEGFEDLITHPNTYSGTESEVVVRICIDPASVNAGDMEIPVQNNINIFNKQQSTIGNIKQGANNNIASDQIDFESVSLHEIGHCVGMAHVNLASESGFTGAQTNYTKSTDGMNGFDLAAGADGKIGSKDDVRGNDGNLHWFRKSNNDPFTIDNVIDKTTYSVNLADLPADDNFAANADRNLSTFLGLPKTEAVMQQGTYFDEAQRTLGHDDVATISYAASGLDEQAGTSDDYTVELEYGGISNSNCDVSLSFTGTTGLAFCATEGEFIGQTGPVPGRVYNHAHITTASIEFGNSFNWYFNQETVNLAPVVTAIDDQVLLEQDILQINVNSSDAGGDALVITAVGLPTFANLVDNGDGTAVITVSTETGDESISQVTLSVTDDGLPNVSTQEVFQLIVTLDTDNDGLTDYDEINEYQTLPDNPDTDGDFISDGDEVNDGSNPNDDTSWPNYADGDISPLGLPDGLINAGDYLIAQRISLGEISATSLELSHGDLFPPGSPDGVIDTSDLILLLKLIQQ
ncbi:MAG: hypothetical protein DRQ44_12640 [Gammaproteobacteria bacterium]|nr:MAG: hypothetical protein DRQ44_12640 [Gammaproteobacteria bacterium]